MAARRGFRRVFEILLVFFVIGLLAAMVIPNFVKARAKAQINTAIANLKQIDGAMETWALEKNSENFPVSLDELVGSDKYIRTMPLDPATGLQYGYAGAGKSRKTHPNAIIVYTPNNTYGTRDVLLANGEIRTMQEAEFQSALSSGASQVAARPQSQQSQAGDFQQRLLSSGIRSDAPAPTTFLNPNGEVAVVNGLVQGPGARGGFAGGVVDSAPARTDSAPVAAGIRPIRVEIPRSGSRCIFKKVLNVQDEKLVIKTRLFGLRSGFWGRGFLTAFLFLIGLGVTWIQWRRESVSTFKVSLGLAIMLLALTVHLLRVKLLGDAMIIGAPVLIMAIAIKILWLAWRRGSKKNIDTPPPSISSNGVAASGASVLLAFMFSIVSLPAQSKTIPIPASPNASIISASYRGMLNEKVAQFDVTMQLVTYSTNQAIALYGGDVSLGTFTANVTNCTLLRDGNWVRLRIPDACQVSLNLKLAVKLGGDITKRQLTFNVPPALSSTLSLVINEANAEVEFPTAVSFQRTLGAKDTRVEAIMGAGDRVEMFWTPRMKRATEVAASVFAQNTSVVSIGSGVVNTRTIMDYQVTQGEIRQIRVRLPAGQRLLRVEGEWLKLWETKPSQGGDMLTVDLIKPVAPSYKLTLELEKVLGNLPATNRVEIPHSMEVIRETGIIGLSGGEELSLSTEAFKDLQRVDQAEFPKTSQGQIISAYRFLKPGFNWVVRAETVQPQIETVVRNATRIGFEQISLTANLDYTIKKAGVFSLQLALPSDFKVTSVVEVGSREGTLTANAPAQNPVMQQQRAEPAPTEKTQELVWTEKENPRLLEIQLRERKQGSFTVRVLLNKRHSETPKTLAISGVHPLAVQKLTGFVTVAADTGLQAKTASFDGLMEVPAASVAESRGGLAFKHISSEPVPAQLPWKLQVTTETVESWVRAEVANWLTFSETLMSGRTIINYDIQNAPVKEFRFRLPVTYTNVEITGLNIRRKDHSGGDWRIELQNKVIGAYNVAVTWESTWSMTNQAGTFMFTGISTDSKTVERETGLVLINARPPLQVREQTASAELVRTDARELPAWAGIANNDTVLAYRYLRPGYQLTLAARRFDSAEVLQALVDSARLSTVVADDGQAMTEFSLVIRNNGRQHLEMELPKGAQVWSAFVAGQAVRPSIRAQRLLLPLERNVIDDAPIAVDITYVTTNLFPAKKGRVGFVTPALDVPLKNARWELYLPPDYKYDRFEGTMSRAEVEDATLVESFSQVDYSRVEDEKKVAQQIWISSNVGKVKSELAKGNIKNLAQTFNQVRQADDNNRDVKALEQTFRRSQGSNLLRAQQKLAVDNYRNANNDILDFQGQQGPVTPMNAWQNDSQVAEQQWSKVEKAQEVTVSKVRPLRVTLPIRGQKLVFNQALQTEIGKPMTVEFYAASNLGVRWFTWFVGVFGGFIGLWLLVVFARAGKR